MSVKETSAEYHADVSHVSYSMLKVFAESPKKYYQMFVTQAMPKPEQTPSLLLGSVVHCLFLEPEKFGSEYAVAPQVDRRTKVGKEVWADFVAESDGKTVIPADVYATATAMVESLRAHRLAGSIIKCEEAIIETPIRWEDDITGIKLKCKPDIFLPAGDGDDFALVIDLKTSQEFPQPDKFKRACYKYNYFMQAGFYVDGCRNVYGKDDETAFGILAVSSQPPYDVYPYKITQEHFNEGYDAYQFYLHRLWWCIKDNDWSAPGSKEFNDL